MSSSPISLGQSLNQAIFGSSNASSANASSAGKVHHGHHHSNEVDASAASSDPATALMQTIQQALSQTGVQAPNSSGALDSVAPTNGVNSASGNTGPTGTHASQAGSDTDGDHNVSAGLASSGGAQQAMFQFMHTLMGAVKSVEASGNTARTSGTPSSGNPYSSLASNVQNLLGQLVNSGSSSDNSGSTITASNGSSNISSNPALQALNNAFQNLLDNNNSGNAGPNTNALGIPQGLPGTQPTLQAFLQNLASDLTKGSAASSPTLASVGGLVSATA